MACVKAPGELRLVEFVAERLVIEAGAADWARTCRSCVIVATVTLTAGLAAPSPIYGRSTLEAACAAIMYWWLTKLSSRCDWNMRSATTPSCAISKYGLVSDMRNVDVHRVFDAWRTAAKQLVVEAVHPAMRPRQLPGPVACGEHRCGRVIDDVLVRKRRGLKHDGVTLRILAARDGVARRDSLGRGRRNCGSPARCRRRA